jgi:5-methylcytosine-specific restriction protein A
VRSVPEWIGKTDDAPFPPRVRLRIFERDKGVCQCGCGIQIRPGDKWQTDHKIALVNGGENRESNGRTILTEHHKGKTAEDVAEKSRTYRVKARHLGIKKRRRTIPGRRFNGDPIPARWVE